jgi:hypothetical protein
VPSSSWTLKVTVNGINLALVKVYVNDLVVIGVADIPFKYHS